MDIIIKWLLCNIGLFILQHRYPYEYDTSDVDISEDVEQLNDGNENVDNVISNHIVEEHVGGDSDESTIRIITEDISDDELVAAADAAVASTSGFKRQAMSCSKWFANIKRL